MTYKMKRRLQKMMGLTLAAVFLLCVPCSQVQAASGDSDGEIITEDDAVELEITVYETEDLAGRPMPCTMLCDCFILIGCSEDGLSLDFSTGANQTASVLGVKDIKIQKKVWYGWNTVAKCAGYEVHDRASSGATIIYTDAKFGATYRVSCIHYGTVDEYGEVENVTDPFVFEY